MPIYEYNCQQCGSKWKEMHGADDKGGKCQGCGSDPIRSIPIGITISTVGKPATAGQRVEKYIEENRQIVKEQIEEARREYKP